VRSLVPKRGANNRMSAAFRAIDSDADYPAKNRRE
jgi:hypothetical protein